MLEANPRASRTVPFVSKATGRPAGQGRRADHARRDHRRAAGRGRAARRTDGGRMPVDAPMSVKEAVLPFKRFRTKEGLVVDSVLGPEMRSTGEVMGIDRDFGRGVRQEPARPRTAGCRTRARCSSRSPTATSAPSSSRSSAWPTSASTHPRRPRAPQRCCGATASRAEVVRKHSERGADGEPHDRRPDQRRRDRHGRQHARAAAARARRRLRDPGGDDGDGQADHHHGAAARRGGAGASRRSSPATSTSRSLQDHAARPRPLRRGGARRERGRPGQRRARSPPAGSAPTTTSPSSRPGVAELARPGQFVALAVGGADLGQPAAPVLLDPQGQARRAPTAAPSTSSSPRTAPARSWLTGLRAARPGRRRRPARPAVPAARRAGGLRARRRRLRLGAAVLARRGAARARLPRRDGARRGVRGPPLRRRRGPPHRRRRHRHHRRRLRRAPRLGERRARRRHRPHRGRRGLRLRPDGDAALGHRRSPTAQGPWPRSPSRSRWPAASGSA